MSYQQARVEAFRLTKIYRNALNKYHNANENGSPDETVDRLYNLEQETYDQLIDFIEDNDLNYSDVDPRGTKADEDAMYPDHQQHEPEPR